MYLLGRKFGLVLADRLAIDGDRRPGNRPAGVEAAELVAGLVFERLVVVVADQEVPERVEVAGPPVAAPLCRAGETDLHARVRLDRRAHAEQLRVRRVLAVILELAHGRDKTPLADPGEPGMLESVRVVALDGDGRDGALVAAVDQAAFPARSPPAIDVARVQHPVAGDQRHIAPVGSKLVPVVRVRGAGCLEAERKGACHAFDRETDLAALSRHFAEAPERHRLLGSGDGSVDGQLSEPCCLARGMTHAGERRPTWAGACSARTSRRSRATSGHETGQTLSGARTIPASERSCRSWRSRASPGSAQGPASRRSGDASRRGRARTGRGWRPAPSG